MTRQPRSVLISELEQQLTWLERSTTAYDAGHRDGAVRMSVQLRTLFHDTGQSHSILAQLKAKANASLLSTSTPPPRPTATFWSGLTKVELAGIPVVARHIPKFGDAQHQAIVPFVDWWITEVIFPVPRNIGKSVCRRGIVLMAANKGGGAHFDPNGSQVWDWLKDGAGALVTNHPTGGQPTTAPFEDAHLAALRQIAYEVLNAPYLRSLR